MLVGRIGLLSTPAVSCLIRTHKTLGGIVITASHNPGGIRHDFGIKFNIENGGPAPDSFTDELYKRTKTISEYRITKELDINLADIHTQTYIVDGNEFIVDVIDPVHDYLMLLKSIFDFDKLYNLIRGQRPFKIRIDSMNGGKQKLRLNQGCAPREIFELTKPNHLSISIYKILIQNL